jgi:hypothetical protein
MSGMVARLRELEAAATPGPWEVIDQIFFAGDDGLGEMDTQRDAALLVAARNALPQLLAIAEAVALIAEQQQKTLSVLRQHGIVFDDIGADPGNWQHVAFTIYTDLCEVDTIARQALAALDSQEAE